ncbi:MAG: hypothetical protein J6L71_04630 [Clostridia bacterium]|nr:hypothetical protein [Clostridia bacterium]
MKHKMKRTLAALLALVLCALTLASCTTGEVQESETEPETIPVEEGISHTKHHGVPKRDFEGETFNSFYFTETPSVAFYTKDTASYYYFTDEEASGDPIKEALWKRDELIEDYLNVNLTNEPYVGDGIVTYIYDDMIADLDSYQQILTHCIYGVASLVTNGYLYDFAALPNVNLTEDWWNLEDMESLSLGKIYPYGRSDFTIPAPHVVTFNKTMIDNLNLENPYELVDSYRWTIDTMFSMAASAAADVNHDARYRGDVDRFGICLPEISKLNSFLISCDQPISRRNSEGFLELALNTEKTVKIVEKFYDLTTVGGAVHVDAYDPSGMYMDKIFAEGRALFALHDPSFLDSLRTVDINYGILPYPMYDEAQREYRSDDWGVLWAVPARVRNPELVGSVVELYSYYSKDTIEPAYYDKVLAGKLVNDLDSRRMLDIIFNSVSLDPINNYFGFRSGTEQLSFVLGKLVIQKTSKNFASYYTENEKTAEGVIWSFYGSLAENGGL